MTILMHVNKGFSRFSEIKNSIPNITERMLTLHLKELERDGLVNKVKSTYTITLLGKDLMPICLELNKWGAKHKLESHGITSALPELSAKTG